MLVVGMFGKAEHEAFSPRVHTAVAYKSNKFSLYQVRTRACKMQGAYLAPPGRHQTCSLPNHIAAK